MSNSIIRSKRPEDPFTRMLQTTVRDKNLSYRARGILARLLSNIDGYRMSADDLQKEGKEGRDAVMTALKELRSARYIVSQVVRNEKQQCATETYVFDEPQPDAGPIKKEKNFSKNKAKRGSAEAPAGKTFDNFKCELIGNQFVVGPAFLAKYKVNFPAVAAERNNYNGIEGYLHLAANEFILSGDRNQVAKENWSLSRWLSWFFGREQEYLGDLSCFGKKYADEQRFGLKLK